MIAKRIVVCLCVFALIFNIGIVAGSATEGEGNMSLLYENINRNGWKIGVCNLDTGSFEMVDKAEELSETQNNLLLSEISNDKQCAAAFEIDLSQYPTASNIIGRVRPVDSNMQFTAVIFSNGTKKLEQNQCTDVLDVNYAIEENDEKIVVAVVSEKEESDSIIFEDFAVYESRAESYLLEMSNETMSVEIDSRNARITGIKDAFGKRLVTGSNDTYKIFYEGRESFTVTEDTLFVKSYEKKNNGYIFNCTNTKLSEKKIEMQIKFSFFEGHLEKEVAFTNNGNENWFAETKTGVYTDVDFRKDSYYYVPWPTAEPLISANEIESDFQLASQVYAAHSTTVTGLYNPRSNTTVTTTLFKQNGIYAGWSYTQPHEMMHIWNTEQPILKTNGWDHRTNRMDIRKGETNAFSVAYFVTKGDSSSFLSEYFESSAIKTLVKDIKPAEWLRDVKFTQYINGFYEYVLPSNSDGEIYFKETQKIVEQMGEGYIMSLSNYYGWQGGDFPVNETVLAQGKGMAEYREKYPQIKTGTFTQHFVAPASNIFQENTDWCIRDADGHYILGYHPEPPHYPLGRYIFNYAVPETIKRMGEDFAPVVEAMDFDFIYNESNEASFGWWYDYGNDSVFTGEENRQWLWQFQNALHAKSDDKVHWLNDPDGLVADFVQLELPSGVWQIGSEEWLNWRSLSDSVYYTKLKQQMLYDGDFNLTYAYENDKYFSYCLAYAAKPNLCAHYPEEVANISRYVPYINAIYELRNGKLLTDAEVSPNWRRDNEVETDVVAMQFSENSAVLTAISHGQAPVTKEITADAKALGIDTSKPVFIWSYNMTNPGPTTDQFQTGSIGYRVLPERNPEEPAIKINTVNVREGLGDRVGQEILLEKWKAGLLTITNTPAFVYSSNGAECAFRLPENAHVNLTGEIKTGKVSVNATVDTDSAKIMVYNPTRTEVVRVNGEEIQASVVRVGAEYFSLIELNKGEYSVEIDADYGFNSNAGGTWTAGWGDNGDKFAVTQYGVTGTENNWSNFVYVNSETMPNYATIETDITIDSDTGRAAILLRANEDGGYHYSFGIEPYDNINFLENGAIRFSHNDELVINEAYESPVKIKKGETYRIRLEMAYTTVTMYINDRPVTEGGKIKVFDVLEYWNQQKIGFMVRGGTATFNNLVVKGMKTSQIGSWTAVWGNAGDTWVPVENGVQGTEDSWDFSKYLNEMPISKYSTVEADITVNSQTGRAGLFICGNDDGGYNFSFGIEPYDIINKNPNGVIRFMKNSGEIEEAYVSPVKIEVGKTYRLKIEQEYTKAKVYINDLPVMNGENIREFDISEFWAYKKVGLIVRGGIATFNNFAVKDILVGLPSNLTGQWSECGEGVGHWIKVPEGVEAPNVGWGRARYINSQQLDTVGQVSADLTLLDGGSNRVAIVIKANEDASESFSFGIEEGSNVRFERMDEQVNYTVPSPVTFEAGKTYNIRVVFNENTAKMYVDGLAVTEGGAEKLFDISVYGQNTNAGVLVRAGKALISSFDASITKEITVLDLITVTNCLLRKEKITSRLLVETDVVNIGGGIDILDLLELKKRVLIG